MAFPKISFLSKEYVRIPVRARRAGAVYDPTGDVVELALMRKPGDETGVTPSDAYNDPAESDWVTGSWDTDGSKYLAKATFGTAADLVPSERGIYQVWVRVNSSPELAVFLAGDVEFF
jgi:hypothetical protein